LFPLIFFYLFFYFLNSILLFDTVFTRYCSFPHIFPESYLGLDTQYYILDTIYLSFLSFLIFSIFLTQYAILDTQYELDLTVSKMYVINRLTVSQNIKGEIIMARTIKKYDERRTEFLNIAQELFFTKGYEQTAVETIIKKIGLSKGTFYYYFKSKEDLLDALVERLSEKILEEIRKIVDRDDLDAITKLNRAFAAARSVKLENLELLKVLLKVLYDDKNILFRFKIYRSSLEILASEFSKIIRQGIKEKAFNTPYPDEAARLIFEIAFMLSERIPSLILRSDKNLKNLDKAEKEFKVYENAIERIVGAEEGTVEIVNRNILNYFHKKINM